MPTGLPSVKCHRTSTPCIRGERAVSGLAALAQHNAHQIGRVLCAELLHDARAMHLNGARRNAELAAGLLVRGSTRDPGEHVSLARGELAVAGEGARQ